MSDTTEPMPMNTESSQVTEQQPTTDVKSSEPQTSAEPTSTEETLTKAQVQEMLTKARQDEKQKLYKSLEKAKKEASEVQAERDKVLEDLNQTKAQLQTLEDSNMSDIEKVSQQVKLLMGQNEALRAQMEQVSKVAETRVRESELKSYRQKRVEESGLMFPEMVSGQSPEEIDASITALREREEVVRTQLEDKLRSELAVNVPRPMSPNASANSVSAADRYSMSKMSPQDYKAMRQKLMAQALDSVRK